VLVFNVSREFFFQLYHGENKLHLYNDDDDDVVLSVLY
jgi:hypothetical protein